MNLLIKNVPPEVLALLLLLGVLLIAFAVRVIFVWQDFSGIRYELKIEIQRSRGREREYYKYELRKAWSEFWLSVFFLL